MDDNLYVVQQGPNGPFVKCPHCDKDVKVGSGGRTNFITQHLPSGSCTLAREKKLGIKTVKPKPKPSMPLSMANFLAKAKAPVPANPSRIRSSNTTTTSKSKSQVATAIPAPKDDSAPIPEDSALPASEMPLSLLEELAALISRLPPSTPEATEYDRLAALAGNPEFGLDKSVDSVDLWEHTINLTLKAAVGGWKEVVDMDTIIKTGRYGLDALLNYARYFIVKRGVDEGLFRGKLADLMDELRKRTQAPTTSTDPLATVSTPLPEPLVATPATNETKKAVAYEVIDADAFEYEDTVEKTSAFNLCTGYALTMPTDKNPFDDYPYTLHSARNAGKDTPDLALPWDYEVRNGLMTIFARSCPRVLKSSLKTCKACSALKHSTALEKLLTRMEDGVHPNAPLVYHPASSLRKIIEDKNRKIQYYHLRGLNQAKTLLGKAAALDEHKRLLMAVASGKVQRIDRVISASLKQKKGTRAILASVVAAARGFYRPRGTTEEEDMRAILIWRLGGNRVAEINHRATGAPSKTYLRSRSTIPPLVPSPARPTQDQVQANTQAVFSSILEVLRKKMSDSELVHAVLMFDELATEKRLRYDAATNLILGLCRQHAHKTSLEFVNEDDLAEIFRKLDAEEVHYAAEATVGAVGILAEDHRIYPARPVLVSGDCKRENGEQHARVIQTVLDGVNAEKKNTNIRIVSLASDGESRRGSAFVHLTLKKLLDKSSPIYNLVDNLSFMDYHVGDDDLTGDKDWKHIFKRLRNLLLRRRGVVVNDIRITPDILKEHMRSENRTADHIRATFDPKDQQDVKLAFDMLKDIWTLPRVPSNTSASPTAVAQRQAIWVLGQALYHLVFPYLCIDLSLSEQIEHLSAAAHMFLALYSKFGKGFIPTELYMDISHLLKNIIFCLAKAKVDQPDSKFYIILLGTDRLEELFGILRTMIGNDANLDILQLIQRLSGTTEVSNILAKYPHWDRPPRRLKLPVLRRDSAELPDAADHLKPGSWRGDVHVKNVSLLTSWNRGRQIVASLCPELDCVLANLEKQDGVNILAPRGVPLFTAPLDGDDIDESHEDTTIARSSPVNVLDARTEVEDAMNEVDCEECTDVHKRPIEKTVVYKGKELPKARALTLASKYRNLAPSSTDRLRRVQDLPRYGGDIATDESSKLSVGQEDLLLVSDPVCSLLSCDDCIWLCLGEVSGIFVEGRSVESIPQSLLQEKITTVSFQLLGLSAATVIDDPSTQHDWRSDRIFEKSFTVPGALIQAIDPAISTTHAAGTPPWYLLSSAVLVALASSLYEGINNEVLKSVPKITRSEKFPYRNTHNEACFLCSNHKSPSSGSLDCPRCVPAVPLKMKNGQRVIEHMAAHILHDPGLDKTWPVCGLCLQPSPLCQYFLKKNTIDTKRSKGCLLSSLSWNYSIAAKSTATSQCTNVPITCPLCPASEPAVWRYFMRAHFDRHHPAAVKSFEGLWARSKDEEDRMQVVWSTRLHVPKKRRSRKVQRAPMVISEEHRAHIPVSNDAVDAIDEGGNASDANDRSEDTDSGTEDADYIPDSPYLPTVHELVQGNQSGSGASGDAAEQAEGPRNVAQASESMVVGEGASAIDDGAAADSNDSVTALETVTGSMLLDPSNSAGIPAHLTSTSVADMGNEATGPLVQPVHQELEQPTEVMPVPARSPSPLYTKRRRTASELIADLQSCCGTILGPDDDNVIECVKTTCETHWYHMDCAGVKEWRKGWVCDSCKTSSSSRPRKRAKK